MHEVDEEGKPTHVRGLRIGLENETREFDAVVAALDVPGIKKLLPESFRQFPLFDKIYKLDTVPIATVQLRYQKKGGGGGGGISPYLSHPHMSAHVSHPTRAIHLAPYSPCSLSARIFISLRYNGWVTELNDVEALLRVKGDYGKGAAPGIDNLLYSADAEFSCFADLALTSPGEYYKEGEGSLIQMVFDERAFSRSESQIVKDAVAQTCKLFPSACELECTWSSVVKLGQALYRENPGQDQYRPSQVSFAPLLLLFLGGFSSFSHHLLLLFGTFCILNVQATPLANFFLAGSYTYQDYLDSMEGATKSALLVADEIISRADSLAKQAAA